MDESAVALMVVPYIQSRRLQRTVPPSRISLRRICSIWLNVTVPPLETVIVLETSDPVAPPISNTRLPPSSTTIFVLPKSPFPLLIGPLKRTVPVPTRNVAVFQYVPVLLKRSKTCVLPAPGATVSVPLSPTTTMLVQWPYVASAVTLVPNGTLNVKRHPAGLVNEAAARLTGTLNVKEPAGAKDVSPRRIRASSEPFSKA